MKLRKLIFGFFVTLDLLGNGMIPKSNIWIWHAPIRARNGIIANVKTQQTLLSDIELRIKSDIHWDCLIAI